MANQFVPVDVRRKMARERTSTPSGGYRFAGQEPPAPAKAPPVAQAGQSGRTLRERLSTEQKTGEVVRTPAKPLGKLFGVRSYTTHRQE